MPPSTPNVILLTIDALRADHCSWHGYKRDITPNLGEFASDNICFLNAQSVSSHTREAIPGFLTGRYPDECVDPGYTLASETIASRLSEYGYQTAGIHSNPYASRAYGFDPDFDYFDDDLRLGQHKILALAQRAFDRLRNRHYASAEQINTRVIEWIETTNEPFFLWAHYMDPHGPYCPSKEYQQRYRSCTVSTKRAQRMYYRAAVKDSNSITADERQEMLDLYDAEIEKTDTAVSRLLKQLNTASVLTDSLIIISSDHGDGFGEHGYYGHPRQLHDCLLHVPLVISTPAGDQQSIESPVSTLDIAPTILDAAHVPYRNLPGKSLLQVSRDATTFDNRIVYAQVRGMKSESGIRRFRATSSTDSCFVEREIETGNVVSNNGADSALCEKLYKHSADRLGKETVSGVGESDSESKEVERRLRALGYRE